MDIPAGFNPSLILALNLAGTFIFGLSGGLAAVRAKLDMFGVVVLAAVVALAGGITRDLLIGTPPATFRDWRYLVAAGAAGLVSFFARPLLDRVNRSVLVFDAFGLGLFCVTGSTKALDFRLGPAQAILLGAITGIGGGMLRDVLLREVPTVLRQELYAIPALLGAGVLVLAQKTGHTGPVFPILGVAVCVVVRLVSLHYDVSVPIAPSEREGGQGDGRLSQAASRLRRQGSERWRRRSSSGGRSSRPGGP
ncbi:MAG TPA: TRIC cation channel family protein [Baekduia sp.]|uniref:trimeric intracellular cation channel family protein n=1 Tax=Baekduia sp. TaxID=2600305 RepID=UPI002D799003|nr:TRIC cation channel family protein [Baekduia sp.]HET6509060.1 TRIC cation channel family protein [Baekduia sp.]